jgi:FixJ family two-component response regulator
MFPQVHQGCWTVTGLAVELPHKPVPESCVPDKHLIAIVDDHEPLREALSGLLRSTGFTAVSFACAEDFLESSEMQATACVIADVNLGGMSGLELHRSLVASGGTIPVVLITAYPDDTMRQNALKAGVVRYFNKPFDDDELLGCLAAVMGQARSDEQSS